MIVDQVQCGDLIKTRPVKRGLCNSDHIYELIVVAPRYNKLIFPRLLFVIHAMLDILPAVACIAMAFKSRRLWKLTTEMTCRQLCLLYIPLEITISWQMITYVPSIIRCININNANYCALIITVAIIYSSTNFQVKH